MLDHALLARTWALRSHASAASTNLQGSALTQITTMVTAVARHAATSCLAASILAQDHATRVCAAHVRSQSTLVAIAVRSRKRSSAAIEMSHMYVLSDQMRRHQKMRTKRTPATIGAKTSVAGHSTAASINAKRHAILPRKQQRTARVLLASSLTALVARRLYLKFWTNREALVTMRFRVATRSATSSLAAGIHASRSAILANVGPA